MEGEERQDKGIGAWGRRMPQPPLKNPRKVESSLGFSSGRFARHGSCCDSLFQWDPCPSVRRPAIQRFLPAYPPVELWSKLAESTIPGPNGDGFIYGGRSLRRKSRDFSTVYDRLLHCFPTFFHPIHRRQDGVRDLALQPACS